MVIDLLYKDSLYFPEPGMIVSLNLETIKICDGQKPFGVIGDYPNEFGLVPIWYDSATIETDMFEPGNYNVKDKLYSSRFGKFTNQKINEDSLLIGFVIENKQNSLLIELI